MLEIESTVKNLHSLTSFTPATDKPFPEMQEEKVFLISRQTLSAQKAWWELRPRGREAYFSKLRRLIVREIDSVVELLQKDTQKPKQEVLLHEVLPVLDALKYYPKLARKVLKPREIRPHLFLYKKLQLLYQPYGAVGVISPWNFPFFLGMNPIIQALSVGNTVVHKPSEFTTQTGVIIQALFDNCGFPSNVVNLVTGAGRVGDALVRAPSISKICFTGSTATGRKILKAAADKLMPVSLELGGKDPLIVLEDVDLDFAAKGAVYGAFANSGQICASTEKAYVPQKHFEKFVDKVISLTEKVLSDQSPDNRFGRGPMISENQAKIVEAQIKDALNHGAQLRCGGRVSGRHVEPTVLTNVKPTMKVMQEETFGPVLPILPYENVDLLIDELNQSNYGLSAAIFSKDTEKAEKVARRLQSAHAMINDVFTSAGCTEAPWGGMKESGLGRLNGEDGLKSFCQSRSIMVPRTYDMGSMGWFPYSEKKYNWFKKFIQLRFR